MEHLAKAQIVAIKKCSNTRLIAKLLSVGYTEEQLDVMDREALLQAWATSVVTLRLSQSQTTTLR